jgi:hypothetical protein
VKRLRRILFNMATVLALVLTIAVVVLWVRSDLVSDSIYRSRWWSEGAERNESAWSLFDGRGGLGIGHRRQQFAPSPVHLPESFWKKARPVRIAGTPFQPASFFQRLGFRYIDVPNSPSPAPNNYYREWNAPFWCLLLLFAPLPVVRIGAAMRRGRGRRRGLCAVCGYDLRATPERCPECGAVCERV